MMEYDPRDWYWAVAGDQSQVYSSRRASLVAIADPEYQVFLQRAVATQIASMDDLTDVLRQANVPPYHTVTPYRIVRRLEEAGVAAAAISVLEQPTNAVLKWRFSTLTAIPADDPDARSLVLAAGANPDEILAPE